VSDKNKLFPAIVLGVVLTSLGLLASPSRIASAHSADRDGDVGALLHIDPEDYPVINRPQTLKFLYSDIQNKFKPMNCTCTVTISHNSQEVFRQLVPPRYTKVGIVTYTFSQPDVYQVRLTGVPKEPGQFTPFTLDYSVAVHKFVPGEIQGSSYLPTPTPAKVYTKSLNSFFGVLIGAAFLSLAAAGYLIYNIQKKPKARRKK
jgi:hypothetical protein